MTAPLNKLDWWRPPNPADVPEDPPFWRDPPRAMLVVTALLFIVGSMLPWAEGRDPVGLPAAYRPTEGTAEGVLLIAFGLLLIFLARGRTVWETTSRSLQLLPLLVLLISISMWLGADFYSRQVIEDWERGGGSGAQTGARLIVAGGLVILAAAIAWLEWRRPPSVKARTTPLLVEWGVTRWSATKVAAAVVLGLLGALVGIIVPALFLGAESMALAVFFAVFGLFIGIGLGIVGVSWLESRARRRAAGPQPGESQGNRAAPR